MSKPMVEAYDLRNTFGKVQALDGLSLAVPAGSVLGLPAGTAAAAPISATPPAPLEPPGSQA